LFQKECSTEQIERTEAVCRSLLLLFATFLSFVSSTGLLSFSVSTRRTNREKRKRKEEAKEKEGKRAQHQNPLINNNPQQQNNNQQQSKKE